MGKKAYKKKDVPNKLPENFLKILGYGNPDTGYGDPDRIKEIFQTCSLEATFGYEEKTAIFYADQMSREMVKWLVEQGADINARNKWGWTPLHDIIAFSGERLDTVKLLIYLGADIQAVTPDGNTPLHLAAEWGRLKIVKRLIKSGADIDAQNKEGENPMEYMLAEGDNSSIRDILPVAEYFLSIGMPVTDKAIRSVETLAKGFAFHRKVYNPDKLPETEEALQCLLELYGVPAPPPKRHYDGKMKITAASGSWQKQFEELYLWIVSPSLDKQDTVQGELLRLSEIIYRLITKSNVTEWSEFGTRVMFHAFLRYLRMGNPLSAEELKEAKCVIREIIHAEKTLRPEKLCEYSVCWIRKNPDPIPMKIAFYGL